MQEVIVNALENLNVAQLIAMGAMFWFFYGRLEKKIDKLDVKLSDNIKSLDEKVTDIDRRLCRLEGAFASKECCMIKDSSQLRKAE